MKTGHGCKMTVLLGLICMSSAHAHLNSEQRLRQFASLPDWSGYWEFDGVRFGPSGGPAFSADAMKDWIGLHPPYTVEWEAKFQDTAANYHLDKPTCTFGFPSLMLFSPFLFQAIVTPEETTLIFDYRESRHILTDGRKHPAKDELFATPWGDSIGHWQGQTLVVDTIGATAALTIAASNEVGYSTAPLSGQTHYIERIRMVGDNLLENQITVEDPIAFTHPWRITRRYRRVTDIDRMVDEDCMGNDRNPVVNGNFTIVPP